jgi:hypothetical protein
MATAFLTGIVAETQRFSNKKTSPKVMTMAAQLMAAGANQQLIATKLEPPKPSTPLAQKPIPPPAPPKPAPPPPIGVLNIPHGPSSTDKSEVHIDPNEIHIDEQGNLKTAGDLLAEQEQKKEDRQREEEEPPPPPASDSPFVQSPPQNGDQSANSPQDSTPGPHSFLDSKQITGSAFTATTEPEGSDPYNTVPIDPLNEPQASGLIGHLPVIQPPQEDQESPSAPPIPSSQSTLNTDNARSAVESALDAAPFDPAFAPPVASLNAQPVADINNDSSPRPPLRNGDNGTPSLQLPTNGHPKAPGGPGYPDKQTSPPPVPPPLMPFGASSS